MQPQNANNNFFGIRVSKPGINVNTASATGLVYESNYSTDTWYDGSGNTSLKIGLQSDGTYGLTAGDNLVKLNSSGLSTGDGSVIVDYSGVSVDSGAITLNSSGLTVTENSLSSTVMTAKDSSAYTLFTMNGATWYWYDKTTGKNVMQVGLLPDGTYGWAVAASGYNVSQGY